MLRALASGSSGNAFLLKTNRATLLIDAGVRTKKLLEFLTQEGVAPRDVSGVLLSHEHVDHCVAARDLAVDYGVALFSNEEVLRALGVQGMECATLLPVGSPVRVGDVEVTSFPVSHDAVCPTGFVIRAGERTITIATDLGQTSADLLEAVTISDLVVLEANHDVQMLHEGRYPYHLKRRVSGPTGHLSNLQAADILSASLRGPDVEVWLAHLSRENNLSRVALQAVRGALRRVGLDAVSVAIAARDKPSLRWNGTPRPRQLSLFDEVSI